MPTSVTPSHGGARFHFDPRYDSSAVPSLEELLDWARDRVTTVGTPLNTCMETVQDSRRHRLTMIGRLLDLIPGIHRRRQAKVMQTSMDALRHELGPVRDTMLEFGTDLRVHRFLVTSLESLASYAIMAPIEREQRQYLADHPDFPRRDADRIEKVLDQIDTEQRIASSHAGIRAALENDALMALLEHEDLRSDWRRHICALKAAIDEVQQVEMRERLRDMIDKVEAAAGKAKGPDR